MSESHLQPYLDEDLIIPGAPNSARGSSHTWLTDTADMVEAGYAMRLYLITFILNV